MPRGPLGPGGAGKAQVSGHPMTAEGYSGFDSYLPGQFQTVRSCYGYSG